MEERVEGVERLYTKLTEKDNVISVERNGLESRGMLQSPFPYVLPIL